MSDARTTDPPTGIGTLDVGSLVEDIHASFGREAVSLCS